MAVSRADRRRERTARTVAFFGVDMAPTALDLLELTELTELAWHDVYGDVTAPDDVIDDILELSGGNIEQLITSALLAVTDWRDLNVAANELRSRRT